MEAIFLGSDLKSDFNNIKDIKLIFTDRDPNMVRSTTNYRKKLTTLKSTISSGGKNYTGQNISIKKNKIQVNLMT